MPKSKRVKIHRYGDLIFLSYSLFVGSSNKDFVDRKVKVDLTDMSEEERESVISKHSEIVEKAFAEFYNAHKVECHKPTNTYPSWVGCKTYISSVSKGRWKGPLIPGNPHSNGHWKVI